MAKKKKWKKKLGKALMAGAALAGGLALAKNRNRNAMIKGADANEGFGAMTLKDYGPHTIGGYHTPRTKPRMMTPRDMANDPFFTGAETLMNDTRMFKKGGRVKGCGIAKRGVGRAMKKGRK